MRKYIIILLASAFVSCSPRIIEKVRTEYLVQTVQLRDTVYTKDSVYLREWLKGDTIYVEKYRDRYVYRDRWRDSVRVHEVHDTITVERKVERELTAGQKAKIGAFPWLLLSLFALLVWIFRTPLLALIRKWLPV